MFNDLIHHIPASFINLFLVIVYSLLIGLEQRRHHIDQPFGSLFGTDRTFTIIGILGYALYVIDPVNLYCFIIGIILLGVLLSISYYNKIKLQKVFGITSILIALLTYCFAPLIYTQPPWLVLLLIVVVLVLTEIKETLFLFTKKFNNEEFFTLAKFLLLAGVILPLLPDVQFRPEIHITPYKMWLAVVIVSGLSYLSYLLKKFIFPKSGTLITGILGGLFSSTVTTIILSKKSKEEKNNSTIVPAIVLANTVMYIRILLIAFLFNSEIALSLLPWFLVFVLVGLIVFFYLTRIRPKKKEDLTEPFVAVEPKNPLEFKAALLFAVLFIVFAIVTSYVIKEFGGVGINILAFIVGLTDIDPFLLNLFQGNWNLGVDLITISVLNAITSNNLMKLVYGIILSDKSIRKDLLIGFIFLILSGLVASLAVYFGWF